MWPNNSLTCFGLVWIFLSFCHHPVAGLLHYSITDPLGTRLNVLEPPPPELQHHPDFARPPRRSYIHHGSRRHVQHSNNSSTINSTWSISPRSPINSGRTVNHHALASLARSANATVKLDSSAVNFGLLNIRSLTSKGHLIQDVLTDRKLDFFFLTETWQQPNDFSSLNDSTPPGFVYICRPRGSGRGGGLAVKIMHDAGAKNKICLREVHYFLMHAHHGVDYPAYTMATYESLKYKGVDSYFGVILSQKYNF